MKAAITPMIAKLGIKEAALLASAQVAVAVAAKEGDTRKIPRPPRRAVVVTRGVSIMFGAVKAGHRAASEFWAAERILYEVAWVKGATTV